MNFIADKKVNTGRQKELDIAKALAIIFMIFCHAIVFASFLSNAKVSVYSVFVQATADNIKTTSKAQTTNFFTLFLPKIDI